MSKKVKKKDTDSISLGEFQLHLSGLKAASQDLQDDHSEGTKIGSCIRIMNLLDTEGRQVDASFQISVEIHNIKQSTGKYLSVKDWDDLLDESFWIALSAEYIEEID